MDSHNRSSDVNIEEWIRQTSAVAVAPDTLVPNESRDTNSPTFTDSSLANSVKVGETVAYLTAVPIQVCYSVKTVRV